MDECIILTGEVVTNEDIIRYLAMRAAQVAVAVAAEIIPGASHGSL